MRRICEIILKDLMSLCFKMFIFEKLKIGLQGFKLVVFLYALSIIINLKKNVQLEIKLKRKWNANNDTKSYLQTVSICEISQIVLLHFPEHDNDQDVMYTEMLLIQQQQQCNICCVTIRNTILLWLHLLTSNIVKWALNVITVITKIIYS